MQKETVKELKEIYNTYLTDMEEAGFLNRKKRGLIASLLSASNDDDGISYRFFLRFRDKMEEFDEETEEIWPLFELILERLMQYRENANISVTAISLLSFLIPYAELLDVQKAQKAYNMLDLNLTKKQHKPVVNQLKKELAARMKKG